MFIRLDSRIKRIEKDLKDERPAEDILMGGTIAVINGTLDFNKTDGYIQFMKIALENISEAYGKQDKKWQSYINRISSYAEKFQDADVAFAGNTKEEFPAYCEWLSGITEESATILAMEKVSLDIITSDDLLPVMKKYRAAGNIQAFYYGKTEDPKRELMNDLMRQLSGMKIEKGSRDMDISYYFRSMSYHSGRYHEHVFDALNVIMQEAVYVMNCASTKEHECYSFDTQHVHNQLRYAESIMQRARNLI